MIMTGFLLTGCFGQQKIKDNSSFKPGAVWLDESGEVINAHGGGMLYVNGRYYWFGEKRGKRASEGVSVYSSKDLYHWNSEGLALAPSADTTNDLASGCLMERPKVIYNAKTKKYVMWFHLELRGQGYKAARAGVAVSDKVTGPYTFLNSFRPNDNMSRDMTLFVDDDGKAYHIYSSRENYDLRIVQLSDDYTTATTKDKMLFSEHREAPAIFKYNKKYYLITSGCTGWAPNKASIHVADSLFGNWVSAGNPLHGPGADSTYGGQSTYILPVAGKPSSFIFIADKWNPHDLMDSRYLWLPIEYKDGMPFIDWKTEWGWDAQQFTKKPVHSFQLADSAFLLDGQPFQIISGEMHYPRVPREAWRDRMRKAKAMGLNTIGTYVFWNLHEPQKGKYDFSGNNDIAAFVKTAQEEGLWVILRPSPYVCAEWEFGGYPYWLQNIKGLEVRSKEPQYLQAYKNYIMQVGKQLAPLQVNHGGNILMVQVENEYGAYGSDREYLDINRRLFIEAGFDGLLYTCDPEPFLAKGNLPGKLFTSINGLDKPARIKQLIKQNNEGKGPYFVAEWYPAWFDWWGTQHHKVPAEKYTPGLDSVLSAGMSVNMYMFHGGTTRDFMNGANYNDQNPYEPQISSYDYDAPLDEAGNPTHKFMEFRNVIQKHLPAGRTLPEVPAAKPTITIPAISFTSTTSLFDVLPGATTNATPLTFEELNQAYGFVLYRTTIDGGREGALKIKDLRDYGLVFINGKRISVLDRRLKQDSIWLKLPDEKIQLDILVENLGRINYGPYLLKNKKGITEGVSFNGKELTGWQMFKLPFNDLNSVALKNSKTLSGAPVLKKGTFSLQTVGDTYLNLGNWGKGVVWVNGHNLGRYWNIGPQQTLYVPVEWLKKGGNEIIVLELLKPEQSQLQAVDKPILDKL